MKGKSIITNIFIFLIISLFFLPYVLSFLPNNVLLSINPLQLLTEEMDNPQDKINEVTQTTSEQLDSLMNQWQNFLLKNEFLKELDIAFKKINLFFFLLIGEDYSFSLNFFLSCSFWLFFMLSFYYVMKIYSLFSEFSSAFISFSFTLINAHLGLFRTMSDALIKLTLSLEYQPLRVGIIILIFIILIVILISLIKSYKETKEKKEKEKEKINREIINNEAETIKEKNEKLAEESKTPSNNIDWHLDQQEYEYSG